MTNLVSFPNALRPMLPLYVVPVIDRFTRDVFGGVLVQRAACTFHNRSNGEVASE
jgi:hypothetical protein